MPSMASRPLRRKSLWAFMGGGNVREVPRIFFKSKQNLNIYLNQAKGDRSIQSPGLVAIRSLAEMKLGGNPPPERAAVLAVDGLKLVQSFGSGLDDLRKKQAAAQQLLQEAYLQAKRGGAIADSIASVNTARPSCCCGRFGRAWPSKLLRC